jgi:deazaflavin-dependent oxidoreductase (nitroreductase family)
MQPIIPNSAAWSADFFRGLNSLVEPLVRAGFASPVCSPVGLIVLESEGRKTGRPISTPLVATRIGRGFLVSTYRKQSQWIKNLRANPQVRYWLGGREYEATALVLTGASAQPDLKNFPPLIKNFVQTQSQYIAIFGGQAALLMPRESVRPSIRSRNGNCNKEITDSRRSR